ncbi:hypothetical protein EFT43_06835 [Leuconostoc falkenbergense]|uniref:UPF0236 family transposase-like protein n=1 Tax=Leuconostoc falkenbergense TaxID=2766470 RepID=UPI0021A9C052|nr:UPF0236 family protein [Leuconostoc falkenbergense]MCT4404615.1 hypothetical protein [Leuconostoc falkenbergense]
MFNEHELVLQQQQQNIRDFLRKIEHFDRQEASVMRAKEYEYVKTAERTVTFTFGEVTFSRRVYAKDGQFIYPVDEKLNLLPYVRFSMELLFELTNMATNMSYRAVAKTISALKHIEVTKDTVFKAVKLATTLYQEQDDYRFFKDVDLLKKVKTDVLYKIVVIFVNLV